MKLIAFAVNVILVPAQTAPEALEVILTDGLKYVCVWLVSSGFRIASLNWLGNIMASEIFPTKVEVDPSPLETPINILEPLVWLRAQVLLVTATFVFNSLFTYIFERFVVLFIKIVVININIIY